MLLCVVGGAFGWRFFQGVAGQAINAVACGVDLQAARASIKKYASEHDGQLPPAATWQDDVKPYFETERNKLEESDIVEAKAIGVDVRLSDPSGVWGCHMGNGKWQAFVYSKDLAGKKISEVKNPTELVLLWEGPESGRNLTGQYEKKAPTSDMTIAGEKRNYLKITLDGDFNNELDMEKSHSRRRRARESQ